MPVRRHVDTALLRGSCSPPPPQPASPPGLSLAQQTRRTADARSADGALASASWLKPPLCRVTSPCSAGEQLVRAFWSWLEQAALDGLCPGGALPTQDHGASADAAAAARAPRAARSLLAQVPPRMPAGCVTLLRC